MRPQVPMEPASKLRQFAAPQPRARDARSSVWTGLTVHLGGAAAQMSEVFRTGPGKRLRVAALIGSLLVVWNGSAAQDVVAPADAYVTVDFASSRGNLFRAERVNNLYPADQFRSQLARDASFINGQGLHGRIYRAWVSDINFNPTTGKSDPNLVGVFDPKTGKYDFEALTAYLDQASRVSDTILVVLNLQSMVRAGWSPAQTRPVIKNIIFELKKRYPKIKYIEAMNEADHNLRDFLKPDDLYRYYVPFYQAVNEVNAELRPSLPLLVGGPALGSCGSPLAPPGPNNQQWLEKFLDGYAADRDPNKRLDFLSYHAYGYFKNQVTCSEYTPVRSDPSVLAQVRPRIESALRKRGLDVNIPSFITEMGPYPGPSYDNKEDPRPDYLVQAAGMASYLYWFLENPKDVPFQWMLRHDTNGRKDQLISHAPGRQSVLLDTFTPYGNQLLMLSKLKKERVQAVSNALKAGKGVYSLATRDQTGIAVMFWNYQGTGTQRYRLTVDMGNLPANLRGKYLRQRIYRIDDKVSNYWGNPSTANLQEVSNRMLKFGARGRLTLELSPNALELVLLEPAKPRP